MVFRILRALDETINYGNIPMDKYGFLVLLVFVTNQWLNVLFFPDLKIKIFIYKGANLLSFFQIVNELWPRSSIINLHSKFAYMKL